MQPYTPEQIEEINRQMSVQSLLQEQDSMINQTPARPGGDELPETMHTLSPLQQLLESLGRRQPQPELYDPSWEPEMPGLRASDDVSMGDAISNLAPLLGDRGGSMVRAIGDGVNNTGQFAGAAGQGIYDYLRKPYQVAPAQFAEDGFGYASEGIEEGKPLKTAGGVGMMATAALPFSGGLAAKAFSGPMRAFASGTAIGASPQLAQEAFSATPAKADDQVMKLLEQQGAIQQQLKSAARAMTYEQQSGRGPKWEAAKQQYDNLASSLSAVQEQVKFLREQNSPENARKQQQLDQQMEANTPFREKYPWAVPAVQSASGGLAALLGFGSQFGKTRRFNKAADDISERWGDAVTRAKDPTDLITAGQAAKEAQHFGKQMDNLQHESFLSKLMPSAAGSAAFALGDAAPMLPLIADKLQSQPGSELYEKSSKELSLDNWKEIAGRMAGGGLFNLIPYKTGKAFAPNKKISKRYDAETSALDALNKHRGGPTSFYKNELQKIDGRPVKANLENTFRKRAQTQKDAAQTQKLRDVEQQAELRRLQSKSRRTLDEISGRSRQEQQTHRQSRRPESSDLPQETSSYLKAKQAYHKYKQRSKTSPEKLKKLRSKLLSEKAKMQNQSKIGFTSGYKDKD